MENNIQIEAAEKYLESKKNYEKNTIIYDYRKTYNCLISKIKEMQDGNKNNEIQVRITNR